MSVAAVVLGGVSLAGGRGGVFGPVVAVIVLQMIQNDMTFLSIDTNFALVAQGLILIGVLMVGSVLESRRAADERGRSRQQVADRGRLAEPVPGPAAGPADGAARDPRRRHPARRSGHRQPRGPA